MLLLLFSHDYTGNGVTQTSWGEGPVPVLVVFSSAFLWHIQHSQGTSQIIVGSLTLNDVISYAQTQNTS